MIVETLHLARPYGTGVRAVRIVRETAGSVGGLDEQAATAAARALDAALGKLWDRMERNAA